MNNKTLEASEVAGSPYQRWAIVIGISLVLAFLSLFGIENPLLARAVFITGVCLALWLGEVVPAYVPTLVLWALTPLLLQPLDEEFRLGYVLGWSADPVLALFLGGFTLSVTARRYGLDSRIAQLTVQWSRGYKLALLILTAAATAGLSMWMSNIPAAAMMIAALRPLFVNGKDNPLRRALLLSVGLGANFGGMATPVGTGPNAIALATISKVMPITFLHWMGFALPLTVGMLVVGLILLMLRFRVKGTVALPPLSLQPFDNKARGVLVVYALTIIAWLTEPLHGASSAIVAILATAVLFGSKLLSKEDLGAIDWSTLGLIAGGIALGRLLEQSGVVNAAADIVPWADMPRFWRLLILCVASATLSALMSNTATVTMLIPLAASFDPAPSTAVLIAIAASMGIPFVISTPPNAMVYGEGGIKSSDLFVPGIILMLLGSLLISLTGPQVLQLLGIP
jgi:solute carrier family 13 (sodium-dependent dicarboxylate transporter), member 2/3/5